MKQVVLITGASSGLGESIATHLAGRGHIVYGTARSLGGQERPFRTLSMDVGSAESVAAGVAQVLAAEGRIDVLVNNAGLGIAGPVETLSLDDCARVLDTNVLGAVRTTQAVLPGMRRQGSGKIINISSIGSEMGLPYRGMYSASKAALDRITEALRTELAPFGVQACVLQPGGVRTDINANRLRSELPEGSPYKETFDGTYALINQSVEGGLDPQQFGVLVEQLLETPVLRRVYRLGKPLEKFSVLLKRLLPSGTYDNMIRKHYRIPGKP